jgi:3-oxoacyl-[acyl-carrier protein] reductase
MREAEWSVPMFEATDRLALVTGAGQGVGAGIAATLGASGATVAVNDVVAARAEESVRKLVEQGIDALAVPFDVTDGDAVESAVRGLEERLGRKVDILVNNAGVPEGMALVPFREMEQREWRRYIELNLYGSLHCIDAVLGGMCDRGWGRIVQISSGAGRTGLPIGVSLYGASKSGIEGFVRHLAQEVARDGVTVNTLALGLMGADGQEEEDRSTATAAMARRVPVGRLGRPTDAGAAVAFLASSEAEWITGQTINLDGGATTN